MKGHCFPLLAFGGFLLAVCPAADSIAGPFDAARIKGVTDKFPVTYRPSLQAYGDSPRVRFGKMREDEVSRKLSQFLAVSWQIVARGLRRQLI